MTDTEIITAACALLTEYEKELKEQRRDASDPRQIGFIEFQLNSVPATAFLLGAIGGRASMKKTMNLRQLLNDFSEDEEHGQG